MPTLIASAELENRNLTLVKTDSSIPWHMDESSYAVICYYEGGLMDIVCCSDAKWAYRHFRSQYRLILRNLAYSAQLR